MKKLVLTHMTLALTLSACQSDPVSSPAQQTPSQITSANPAQTQTQSPSSALTPDQTLTPGSPAGSRPTPVIPTSPGSALPANPAPQNGTAAQPQPAVPVATRVVQASNYNTETLIAGLRASAGQKEAEAIALRHGLSLTRYMASLNSAVYSTQGKPVPELLQALKAEASLEFVEADQVATQLARQEKDASSFGILSEGDETADDNNQTEESGDPDPEETASPEPSAEPTAEPTPEPTPTPMPSIAPNDPNQDKQYNFQMLNVPKSWQTFSALFPFQPGLPNNSYFTEANVGVIDAGIASGHKELIQAQKGYFTQTVPPSYDAYSRLQSMNAGDVSSLNFFKSSYKQGTHSAGLIAAHANNGLGIVGIAPRARVIPIKTAPDLLDKIKAIFQSGSDSQQTLVSVIADAITWAVEREPNATHKPGGVDVLLIDTPVTEPSEILKRAVAYAQSREVVVVVPSGDVPEQAQPDNSGYCYSSDSSASIVPCADENATNRRLYNYLATLDGVVAVGAVDKEGNLASFSATGPFVSVVAPGVDVLGPVPALLSNNSYSYRSGTAVAAAQVAGVLALIIGADKFGPGTTYHSQGDRFRKSGATYKQLLENSALDKGAAGYDNSYGHGLVDAAAALERSLAMPNQDMKR